MAIKEIETVAEVEINDTTAVFVIINEINGRLALDVRRWFINDENQWAPTGKGISISNGAIEKVVEGIVKANDRITELNGERPEPTRAARPTSKVTDSKTTATKKPAARKTAAARKRG